jgi:DNA polymerase-1
MLAIPQFGQLVLNGLLIDQAKWGQLSIQKEVERRALVMKSMEDWGLQTLNPRSPKQMYQLITSWGYSVENTSKEELEKLKASLESQGIADANLDTIIRLRKLEKMVKSYGETWPKFINPVTHRIHANYKQCPTLSGRSSASEPNPMQIPRNSDMRAAFIPAEGHVMITSDYGQFELRILAEQSQDSALIEIFQEGRDLHTEVAKNVFNTETPTSEQRQVAKMLNFGTVYGIGAGKLSLVLKCTLTEAQFYLKRFNNMFPEVRVWQLRQQARAQETGLIRAPSGRTVDTTFDKLDRTPQRCKNFAIQETNATVLKLAMRGFYEELPSTWKLVNIVHDETVFEVPEEDAEDAARTINAIMREAGEVFVQDVPVVVETKIGHCWMK